MKVLVVGLGSMGQRRIRLMKKIASNYEVIGVDMNQERRMSARNNLGIVSYDSLEKALENTYDCAIVSTSPLSHMSIILELLKHRLYIFTELNLTKDGYSIFIENEKKLFLSSTLLYRKDLQYVINKVENSVVNYNYHVGQYLPDWHPWESYKNYFVGDKRTNGCREIMAIDLPWLIEAFGEVVNLQVIKSKMTNLEIDYNDNYILLLEHKNGTKGSLIVDVVSRKAVRTLEVFSEDIYLSWNGTPDSLSDLEIATGEIKKIDLYESIESRADYSANIIEDAYEDELRAFIELVLNNSRNSIRYSFAQDEKILSLIDRIEE